MGAFANTYQSLGDLELNKWHGAGLDSSLSFSFLLWASSQEDLRRPCEEQLEHYLK